jgi:hypothetical protein
VFTEGFWGLSRGMPRFERRETWNTRRNSLRFVSRHRFSDAVTDVSLGGSLWGLIPGRVAHTFAGCPILNVARPLRRLGWGIFPSDSETESKTPALT